MWRPTTQAIDIQFGGGMSLLSSSRKGNAGRPIAALNFEVAPSGGYRPCQGYEPVDGQTKPSEAVFQVVKFENLTADISAGDTVTDGAAKEGIALIDSVSSDGVGYIAILHTAGTFATADELHVSGKVADVTGVEDEDTEYLTVEYRATKRLAIAAQMALISTVPGSGRMRGVVKFKDTLYAFRDNVGGTACEVYKSSASGWTAVDLGSVIEFEDGHGLFKAGQVITSSSGGTGVVGPSVVLSGEIGHTDLQTNGGFDTDSDWTKGANWVISGGVATHTIGSTADLEQSITVTAGLTYHLTFTVSGRTSGSITAKVGGTAGTARSINGTFMEDIVAGAGGLLEFTPDTNFNGSIDNVELQLHGDAAGKACVSGISGTFAVGDNIETSTGEATLSVAPVATTLLPGGLCEFVIDNFYGTMDRLAVYGADGVNNAFEFNEHGMLPISTGMEDDTPHDVAVFKHHLFLAFGSSLQHSDTGEPHSWTGIGGAAEIGLSDDETGMLPVAGSLVIWMQDSVKVLSGTTKDDWVLTDFSDALGATAKSVQMFGATPLFVHQKHVTSLSQTSAYGDFKHNSESRDIDPYFDSTSSTITASCVIPWKSQYRLFMDNGDVIVGTKRGNTIEWMPFVYPLVVYCVSPHGDEMFFGSDDGYVYQMDSGSTFAGTAIDYMLRMPYSGLGNDSVIKSLRKARLDLDDYGGHNLSIKIFADAGKYRKYTPDPSSQSITSFVGSGIHGASEWGTFTWSGVGSSVPEAYMAGFATEFSFILYTTDEVFADERYTLSGLTIYFSNRGVQR